ncbi:MAG: amidase [Pseudomonadota bacterium]
MFTRPSFLADTSRRLRDGFLDPQKYYTELSDWIAETDKKIHALLPEPGRRMRLLSEAKETLQKHVDYRERPTLFCVPVAVKDIFRVNGFPTSAGSALPPETFEGAQSTVVSLLRAAGMLILGKSVTTEFALSEPGPTRNPHDLEHTPGGSSSGSAAAVAAGFCPVAIGSQTIGSIIRPASYCGVVGFKPTYGRVPFQGVIPLAPSMDHVGWFSQDVSGARGLGSILVDNWEMPVLDRRPVLGLPDETYLAELEPEGQEIFKARLTSFKEAGYVIRPTKLFENIRKLDEAARRLLCAEMARVHRDWFQKYNALYRAGTAQTIREGQRISPDEVKTLRAGRLELADQIEKLMDSEDIDLWISPSSTGPAPKGLASTGNRIMSAPWTYAGLPAVSMPFAKSRSGLPMGVQFVTRRNLDEKLLLWVEEMESLFLAHLHTNERNLG